MSDFSQKKSGRAVGITASRTLSASARRKSVKTGGLHTGAKKRRKIPKAAGSFHAEKKSANNAEINNGFRSAIILLADRISKIAVLTLITAAVALGSYMAITSYIDGAVRNYPIKASQCLSAGEYRKAADLYAKYLSKYPDNKSAALGYLESAVNFDKTAATESAYALLESGLLSAADYPHFTQLCVQIGDHNLNIAAYSQWLGSSPGHIGAMIELAGAYITSGSFEPALEIIQVMIGAGNREPAAVLLGRAVEKAKSLSKPAPEIVALCKMWHEADETDINALLSLAAAYSANGMESVSEEYYRKALGMNAGSAEAYDGILSLLYRNERLRDKYDLLEAAVRNAGGRKYRDLLDSTRVKLAEYYSTVREDGITYKDGIFRITRYDPDGNEIFAETPAIYGPDEISYLIEFYDDLGDAKEMFLDCARVQTRIADVDLDGYREVLIKRYVTAGGMSEEAMRNSVWYDVYRIDRDINKLIFSTPDHSKFFRNAYIQEINRKIAGLESLSDAMEGHYGVVYGLLYALKAAALDFANGDWAPNGTGVDLRGRLCVSLIVPDLEQYVADKATLFGYRHGDFRVLTPGMAAGGDEAGGIYPGMTEEEVAGLLGPPRYASEEEMKSVRPDGAKTTIKNRILEYAGINIYVSDGVVKAFRVNSRDYDGPRSLRIGDTIRDVINKFPSSYFDDTANFPVKKANAEVEFMDTERGIVLNYVIENGIIMGIEIFVRDAGGDWKPGTNIETVIPPGGLTGDVTGDSAAGSAAGSGADAAGATVDGTADGSSTAQPGDTVGAEAGTAPDLAADGAANANAVDAADTANAGGAGVIEVVSVSALENTVGNTGVNSVGNTDDNSAGNTDVHSVGNTDANYDGNAGVNSVGTVVNTSGESAGVNSAGTVVNMSGESAGSVLNGASGSDSSANATTATDESAGAVTDGASESASINANTASGESAGADTIVGESAKAASKPSPAAQTTLPAVLPYELADKPNTYFDMPPEPVAVG